MLKYVGDGAFLQGVPARDLTDEEASEHGGEDALVASGLYAGAVGPGEGAIAIPVETKQFYDRASGASEVTHGR